MNMDNKKKLSILKDITIISDTRERKNQHIINYLDENKIPYIVDKLDSGDYSLVLPNYPELNMDRKIIIERKNSLTELAGNFTKGRERFKNEFERIGDSKIHLVVETATFKKLHNGSYRSEFSPKAYMASLLTWQIRYDCPIWFAETTESPNLIYQIMYYELNEFLNSKK